MGSKKRDFLSFVLFFIGIWSIPFWYPFIIQSILEVFLWVFGVNLNIDCVGNFLVWLYGGFIIFMGFVVKNEDEWYMQLFSYLSYIIGALSVFYLVCVV